MNDILDIEIILKKQKYNNIYNVGIILLIILSISIYISFIYKYKTYYVTKGTMINGELQLIVEISDIKYITNNNRLKISNNYYQYEVSRISEELYVDDQLKNYKYIYLQVDSLNNLNNFVYDIKIEKENKKIIEYLKEYI